MGALLNVAATATAARRAKRPGRLTPSAERVLVFRARGFANKEIAAELGISIKTVEKHTNNGMQFLGLHTTAGIVHWGIASGRVKAGDVSGQDWDANFFGPIPPDTQAAGGESVLLPCPFCGGSYILGHPKMVREAKCTSRPKLEELSAGGWRVCCYGCGVQTWDNMGYTREQAVAAWNTRAARPVTTVQE